MPLEQNKALRLEWRERFAVGVESLDADHRELVCLIDAACCAAQAGERAEMLQLLDRMAAFVLEHVVREEKVLDSIPGDFADHVAEHQRYVKGLTDLRQTLGAREDLGDVKQICGDLIDWFVKHAVGQDSTIRGYFYGRR